MLKQLQLQAKLKKRMAELEKYQARQVEFNNRSQDLLSSLDEATNDEDIALVQSGIDELDSEMKTENVGEKITEANTDIEKINTEITDIEERGKAGQAGTASTPTTPTIVQPSKLEGNINMRNSILKHLGAEERNRLITDSNVKEFLKRARELKGEHRSVNNTELLIPDVMLEILRDNMHRYSKLISKVNWKSIKGKARQRIAGVIPEAIWVEATAGLNELSFGYNQVEVDGYKVGGYIAIPNSTLEDSDINLFSEITDNLGQSIGIAVDKSILYGKGIKMPQGIITRLAQATKPSDWDTNAPEWENLSTTNIIKFDGTTLEGAKFFSNLVLKLGVAKSNYSNGTKIWCMNNNTYTEILSKTIAFNAAGAIVATQSMLMPIVGGEIVILDFMPDGDIIGGYSSLYLLAERAGTSLALSDQVRFIEDQTVFKGTARYDGIPVIGKGFIAINIKNVAVTTSLAFAEAVAEPPAE